MLTTHEPDAIQLSRCRTIEMCLHALYNDAVSTDHCTLQLDVHTRLLHAVKGSFNAYKPIKNAGGLYSDDFYKMWCRHTCLDEVENAEVFVWDMDEKELKLQDAMRLKRAENEHDDDFEICNSAEYTTLVAQTLAHINEYVELLSNTEKLVLAMNILVDFENGGIIIRDQEKIAEYYKCIPKCRNRAKPVRPAAKACGIANKIHKK